MNSHNYCNLHAYANMHRVFFDSSRNKLNWLLILLTIHTLTLTNATRRTCLKLVLTPSTLKFLAFLEETILRIGAVFYRTLFENNKDCEISIKTPDLSIEGQARPILGR